MRITAKDYFEENQGKLLECDCNNVDGILKRGSGVICGYKDNYIILGFETDYEGCVKEFTSSVVYDKSFKSYRFFNINKLGYDELGE